MVQTLDEEINNYLPHLGTTEKQSLISVIKSFLSLREKSEGRISIEQYNKEQDEAVARVLSGKFITQEEVERRYDKQL